MTKLEKEVRDLKNEFSKVNTEILNLDKFIDFAFKMRSNLFGLWELQGLEGQRKILRGISDKILSLCETNESSAIMELTVTVSFFRRYLGLFQHFRCKGKQ